MKVIQFPKLTNRNYPSHGTERVMAGKLKGQTDTDYFYFVCPECKDEILQVEPLEDLDDAGIVILRLGCYCLMCGLTDSFKIPINAGKSNSGWKGGSIKNLPSNTG